MNETAKPKSRIMEAVHEGDRDLHRLGFIDKRKMLKYDLLCLEPVQHYDAVKISMMIGRGRKLTPRARGEHCRRMTSYSLTDVLGCILEKLCDCICECCGSACIETEGRDKL